MAKRSTVGAAKAGGASMPRIRAEDFSEPTLQDPSALCRWSPIYGRIARSLRLPRSAGTGCVGGVPMLAASKRNHRCHHSRGRGVAAWDLACGLWLVVCRIRANKFLASVDCPYRIALILLRAIGHALSIEPQLPGTQNLLQPEHIRNSRKLRV